MKNINGRIQTVSGLIEPSALGSTLMHEHILCDLTPPGQFESGIPESPISLENLWEIRYHWCKHPGNNRLVDYDTAIKEVNRFESVGGSAIVDLTSTGIKRDPVGLKNIAEKTGVHIIMGTGYYTEEYLSSDILKMTPDVMARQIIDEFFWGAEETEICPGIIGEIGCSFPLTEFGQKVLGAAVTAQNETGASVSIHPGRNPQSPETIIAVMKKKGGEAARIIISHIDRTIFDFDTLLRLVDTGCVLEYDFFGIESSYYPFQDIDLPNDGMRLGYIRKLVDRGYIKQILISQDICTKTRLTCYGGHGYGHIHKNVVPMMKRKGFSDAEIHTLLVKNPIRLLTIK
jgi:phosphotriesterase-related protein